jgi:cytochrome c551/c552
LAVRLGPVLGDLKGRVNAEWVSAFLADPQQVKAGTMMPGLFEGLDEKEKAVQVEAVTHYLMSLKPAGKAAKPKVPKHANAERGSAVFHQVGCVACHAPTADFHPAAGAPKQLVIAIAASGRDPAGSKSAYSQCTSRGALEKRIAERVQQIVSPS